MSDYLAGLDDIGSEVDYSAGVIPGTTMQADPGAPGVAGSAGVAVGTGTGQHGAVPVEAGGGGMAGAVTRIYDWLNAPFIGQASPADVFLLVGVVLVAIVAWNLVLYHIRIAAESI
jgi:hypothetical protein